jgi:23S rRNA (cytidine1920-2'-O)/16S rRNA (cytidine1409-2'-O)-methyltransferase
MPRRRALVDELGRQRPDLDDPEALIRGGRVLVDRVIVTNPASMVGAGASVVVRPDAGLRGSVKLRAALDAFGVSPEGRVCLDVGAAAGGFTAVLLERGAARVYAVDVGHGQLLGSLRQDPRVVNLESTNLSALASPLIPEPIGLVTIDVSYLSLAEAAPQLGRVPLDEGAELIALVKPMFELRRATAPTDEGSLEDATRRAREGAEAAGWRVQAQIISPVTGAKGAVEGLLHARNSP